MRPELGRVGGGVGAQAAGEVVEALNALDVGGDGRDAAHPGVDMPVRGGDAGPDAVGDGEHLALQAVGPQEAADGVLGAGDLAAEADELDAYLAAGVQKLVVVHGDSSLTKRVGGQAVIIPQKGAGAQGGGKGWAGFLIFSEIWR